MNFITRPNNTTSILWLSMALSVILPVLLGYYMSIHFTNWRWIHYPLHAMFESAGALSALIISTVMLLMISNNHLSRRYVIVACALIGMGILDGFHAFLYAGESFVWLHSLATMTGGLIFSTIWFFNEQLTVKKQNILVGSVIIYSLLLSIFLIFFTQHLPRMVIEEKFSLLAAGINISGGIGFLVGSSYFIYHRLKFTSSQTLHQNQDIVFANHCLLFGIAGLLFEASVIWDAGWWWWHLLRLTAYFVVLLYFFSLFKEQQNILRKSEEDLTFTNRYLEQRVFERTRELEKANHAKSEFLSRMSHELRTPMNAILGFGQLLDMDETLQKNQKESISEILVAGNHLLELINEILDLSKIEEGRLLISYEDVNLTQVVSESVSNMVPVAKERNITLVDNTADTIKYIINADKLRLKQVLLNLLSNAIKYNSQNGSVFIDIKNTNDKVRVSVRDTGAGITKEQQEKLFIPFERLDYQSSAIEGTGIGLALSKKMAALMNAEIGVDSIPGQGSTFYVEFSYQPP